MRASLPILAVFALLLANFAQLQPGLPQAKALFDRVPATIADIQQYRLSNVWVSSWARAEMWHYLAIWICGLWATVRIRNQLNCQTRWFLVMMPVIGISSVLASYLLLDRMRWFIIPAIQPAQTVIFVVAFASVTCGIAGIRAARMRQHCEAVAWLSVVLAFPVSTRVLDFLKPGKLVYAAVILTVSAVFTVAVARWREKNIEALSLAVPIVVMLWAGALSGAHRQNIRASPVAEISDWAGQNTWGGSMFLFPDAGRAGYPGMFRAMAKRAVWVDWTTGEQAAYFDSFADEWWRRWHDTMEGGFSTERLRSMLSLPIDYYVLKRADALADVRPVFTTRELLVYDARDLRTARLPLRFTRAS